MKRISHVYYVASGTGVTRAHLRAIRVKSCGDRYVTLAEPFVGIVKRIPRAELKRWQLFTNALDAINNFLRRAKGWRASAERRIAKIDEDVQITNRPFLAMVSLAHRRAK